MIKIVEKLFAAIMFGILSAGVGIFFFKLFFAIISYFKEYEIFPEYSAIFLWILPCTLIGIVFGLEGLEKNKIF